MLSFKNVISVYLYPLALLRLLFAVIQFFSTPRLKIVKTYPFLKVYSSGDQERIASLRNIHEKKRCFIIANGPSLAEMDLSFLKDEITIGCNGIYKKFQEWGFHTTYYMTADVNQAAIRSKELARLKGPIKLTALHTSTVLPIKNGFTYFYKAKHHAEQYAYEPPIYPQFSEDFASIVYHGYTIAYSMLQLAYHLGCNEVVVIGLDHDYGELPVHFPPGKLTITDKNIDAVRKCHFDKDYYKVGDEIGVPFSEKQELAYALASKKFSDSNRTLVNASVRTKLTAIERSNWARYTGRIK